MMMATLAAPPGSTRSSLTLRIAARARQRWPERSGTAVRFRGGFAYIDGHLADGTLAPLFRLRYAGSANRWGFAINRASHDDYEESFLPSGNRAGSPEEALDCACGLYLNDPTAWWPNDMRSR